MAGSYAHIKNGFSMIENMCDASECIEELLWLVESQIGSDKAELMLDLEFYPMKRGEKPDDQHMQDIYKLIES